MKKISQRAKPGNNPGEAQQLQLPRRSVWPWALAAFMITVLAASILSHNLVTSSANAIATPPPQTIDLNGAITPSEPTATLGNASSINPADAPNSWKEITVRKGDTLSDILQKQRYDSNEINQALQSNSDARALYQLRPGEVLRFRVNASDQLQELRYNINPGETLCLIRRAGHFEVSKESRNLETRIIPVTGTIESSLFEDGQVAGLSDALILKLVEIFGWDIDFALDLRRGDSFSVLYEEKYWLGQKIADGQILAAEFVSQSKVFRAIAYRDASGFTAYYAPEGTSVRRAFLRTPVEFSRISSRFSSGRFHPILKSWRAHKGVDYSAPTGTPIRATATGRILSMGVNGGYGKCVVIRHGGSYSTLYGHLSRYNASFRVGSYVEQGQIIGYVGRTGLATGPHLHYEFRVDGTHRNPLTFKFPGAAPIQAEYRQDFLQIAETRGAQLDIIGRGTQVAKQ